MTLSVTLVFLRLQRTGDGMLPEAGPSISLPFLEIGTVVVRSTCGLFRRFFSFYDISIETRFYAR